MKLTVWRDRRRVVAFRLHIREHIYGLNLQRYSPHVWVRHWAPCQCEGCRHDPS